MKKERFEQEYNVKVEDLTWEPHYSKIYETAVVGDYCVYHDLEDDIYDVTYDNSSCMWRHDLGKILNSTKAS